MAIASSSSSLLLLMFLAFLDHGAAVANLSSIEAAVRDRAFQLFRRTSEIVADAVGEDGEDAAGVGGGAKLTSAANTHEQKLHACTSTTYCSNFG
uniref:Uncharacterized protein n=1 Tax=Oryza barthii TaxID=65489 RepID=A0A0D3GD27_9ORYZ